MKKVLHQRKTLNRRPKPPQPIPTRDRIKACLAYFDRNFKGGRALVNYKLKENILYGDRATLAQIEAEIKLGY